MNTIGRERANFAPSSHSRYPARYFAAFRLLRLARVLVARAFLALAGLATAAATAALPREG